MMEETKQLVEYSQPYSVELRKLQNGYSWTIKIRDSDIDRMLTELTDIDQELRIRFGEDKALGLEKNDVAS